MAGARQQVQEAQKKVMETMTSTLDETLKTVQNAAREAQKNLTDGKEDQWTELATLYEKVHLKIFKKDPSKNRFGFFMTIEDQSPEEIKNVGIEAICKDQGGAGEYEVLLVGPTGKQYKFGPFTVFGVQSYTASRAERDAGNPLNGVQGALNPLQMAQLGVNQTGPGTFQIESLAKYMGKQSEMSMMQQQKQQDTTLAMMMQSQQQNMQMMMAMMNNNNAKNQPDERVMKLEAELQRERDKRESDLKFETLLKEIKEREANKDDKVDKIAALAMAFAPALIELFKSNQAKAEAQTNNMLQFMASMNQSGQAASQANMAMMTKVMEMNAAKPAEDEKMANMAQIMMGMVSSQVSTIGQIAQMGLLGGQGGNEHPIADVIKTAFDNLGAVGSAFFASKGAGDAQQEMEEAPIEMPQAIPQLPPASAVIANHPMQSVNRAPIAQVSQAQEAMPEAVETEGEPEENLFDEEAMKTIEKDGAFIEILSQISNGLPACEISARLLAHASSGNKYATAWLNDPQNVGNGIMQYFGIHEVRINQILEDNIKMIDFIMNQNGDPNEWSKETGYKPIKKKKVSKVATPEKVVQIDSNAFGNDEKPEIGVKQAVITEAPAVTPDSINEESPAA